MTASTEQFVDIAKRSQDLVTESVRSWTDAMQGVTRQFAGGTRPQLPDTGAAVDRVFDFYEQVLGQQREFAKTVVGAGSSVVDQFTEQATRAAESVTEHAAQDTEKVSESAQKAARTPRTAGK
ncbi:hypothetical protein [Pseudonocardia parietis]|jgi:hypothetical protein|uniref:Gas vesicle protein n=1 Tax=Pseudonocardia parietis TaxID=570936 RepID=A0ABS4VYV2_9PSEU|nr:hypothetical protein [Pseudonocardia parietis]MBP2369133.1 gas vesicle protein [Pseudonocardia parietis]